MIMKQLIEVQSANHQFAEPKVFSGVGFSTLEQYCKAIPEREFDGTT